MTIRMSNDNEMRRIRMIRDDKLENFFCKNGLPLLKGKNAITIPNIERCLLHIVIH